jgi:hypothetical protein
LRAQVPGLRLFGDLHPLLGYSVEYARQWGQYQAGDPSGEMQEMAGYMLDLRLDVRTPEDTALNPVFKLQYTVFSGDDPNSHERYEGWHPLFADNVALFRDECYYTINNGNWTNLHQYRVACEMVLRAGNSRAGNAGRLTVTPAWSSLHADCGANTTSGNGSGGGSHIGEAPSFAVDYQVKSWWTASLMGAYFIPGSYYQDGKPGEWIRLMMTFTY